MATEVTDELLEAFVRLVPQLSRSAAPPGRHELADMLDSPSISVLMARDATGALVGSLTLVIFRIPTGVRAFIEDVVVDDVGSGAGAADGADQGGVGHGRRAGRPHGGSDLPALEGGRQPAVPALGFERRDTNVYRYSFP